VTPETCRAIIRLNKLCDLCIYLELYTRIHQLSFTKLHDITNSKTNSMVEPYLWS